MKIAFLISSVICLSVFAHSQSNNLPSDSLILTTILGRVDEGGIRSTISHPDEELVDYSSDSILVFKVSYKESILIDQKEVVFVMIRAVDRMLQGHFFGFINTYYLEASDSTYRIIYKSETKEPEPIGDDTEPEIIQIGKSKFAIKSTFESSGNHHIERSINFHEITSNGLINLLRLEMDYSNEAWIDEEQLSDSTACPIRITSSTYQTIRSDKIYYDIQTTTTTQNFNIGCNPTPETTESITYIYDNGRYIKSKR